MWQFLAQCQGNVRGQIKPTPEGNLDEHNGTGRPRVGFSWSWYQNYCRKDRELSQHWDQPKENRDLVFNYLFIWWKGTGVRITQASTPRTSHQSTFLCPFHWTEDILVLIFSAQRLTYLRTVHLPEVKFLTIQREMPELISFLNPLCHGFKGEILIKADWSLPQKKCPLRKQIRNFTQCGCPKETI